MRFPKLPSSLATISDEEILEKKGPEGNMKGREQERDRENGECSQFPEPLSGEEQEDEEEEEEEEKFWSIYALLKRSLMLCCCECLY